MDARSRVWPVLVSSSLNLGSLPSIHIPEKRGDRNNRFFDLIRFSSQNVVDSLSRFNCLNELCGSSETASDIFCVTGGITAITGSLIAGFGIFPKNQVSQR